MIPLQAERLKLLSDIGPLSEYFFKDPETPDEKGRRKWLTGDRARAILDQAIAQLGRLAALTESDAQAATDRIAEAAGTERGPVIHTLRISATGRTVGAGLFETLAVLGRERVLARLERAKGWITD